MINIRGAQQQLIAIKENCSNCWKPEDLEAVNMAIRSLGAWEKVKEELKENANFDNVDDLVECTRIIDKHLKEVER